MEKKERWCYFIRIAIFMLVNDQNIILMVKDTQDSFNRNTKTSMVFLWKSHNVVVGIVIRRSELRPSEENIEEPDFCFLKIWSSSLGRFILNLSNQ